MASFGSFLTYLFLPQEEEKMKQMLNTLNISDFISKCTNYIYIYIYIYICDPVCEKGSYSLSNCIYMVTHNLTGEYGTSLQFGHSTTLTWQ